MTARRTRKGNDATAILDKPRSRRMTAKQSSDAEDNGKTARVQVQISPPNMQTAEFRVIGTTPYIQQRFGEKARSAMQGAQEGGQPAKNIRKRGPKDFKALYEQAQYRAANGNWNGIPAMSFRLAMISACRLTGFAMTRAKLAVFVEADGVDRAEGKPLVRIKGKPKMLISPVRNADGGMDLRARPCWDVWECVVRVRYDADQLTLNDVTNLLMRAGVQVGIGEGRADSRQKPGEGHGAFKIESAG